MQQTWQEEIVKLSDQLVAVTEHSDRLAAYFNEGKKNFSLHRCLETLHDFLGIVDRTRKVFLFQKVILYLIQCDVTKKLVPLCFSHIAIAMQTSHVPCSVCLRECEPCRND